MLSVRSSRLVGSANQFNNRIDETRYAFQRQSPVIGKIRTCRME
jgi:hypothetical protein